MSNAAFTCKGRNKTNAFFTASVEALILIAFVALFFTTDANADELKKLKTRYATVYYATDADFYGFALKIGSLGKFGRSFYNAHDVTRERIDKIVERVESLLNMRPKNLSFNIYIYATREQLQRAFRAIGITDAQPLAFYSHRARAIYISIEDLREGVLAHETAHAVLCFYFAAPPPVNIQEFLAQYVDRHLRG